MSDLFRAKDMLVAYAPVLTSDQRREIKRKAAAGVGAKVVEGPDGSVMVIRPVQDHEIAACGAAKPVFLRNVEGTWTK